MKLVRKSFNQKFYEKCILATFNDPFSPNSKFAEEASELNKFYTCFEELIIDRALHGFKEIPVKENFKKWGFEYITQLLYWIPLTNNKPLKHDFIEFLNKNLKLFKFDEHEIEVFSDVFYEYFLTDVDYASKLSDFILTHFKANKWHKKIFTYARATGSTSLGIDELMKIGKDNGYL